MTEIAVDDVYAALDNQNLSLNRLLLEECRMQPIPDIPWTARDVLKWWNDLVPSLKQSEYKALTDETPHDGDTVDEVLSRMTNFVKALYGLPVEDARPCLDANLTVLHQQRHALAFILNTLKQKDADEIIVRCATLIKGCRFCPAGQVVAIDTVAYGLMGASAPHDFAPWLKWVIAQHKQLIFQLTFTPPQGTQNVHVYAHWLNQLGQELGIWGAVPTFENRLGTMDQDPFGGYKGNALQAFYQKFTPSYVIQVVQDAVNAVVYAKIDGQLSASTPRINDVWEWLMNQGQIPNVEDVQKTKERMEAYFTVEEDSYGTPLPGALHAKGAEQILRQLGVLIAPSA